MKRNELLELIPAYVLGALDDDERTRVEALIETDLEAQELMTDYQSIAALMPLATPLQPAPPHLKGDLRQRLANPQISPDTSQETVSQPLQIVAKRYRVFIPLVAALFVLVIGGLLFVNRPAPEEEPPGLVLYREITRQIGFQRYEVVPTETVDTTGELVVSADGTQAVLRIAQLPDIEQDQRYQLWMIGEEAVESGGLFYWPTGHGPYYIIMPLDGSIEQYNRFGMSVEPENGSPFPDAPSGMRLFSVLLGEAS